MGNDGKLISSWSCWWLLFTCTKMEWYRS